MTLRLGFARMGVCGGKMQLNGGYNWRYASFYVILWQNEINHIKTMLMKRCYAFLLGLVCVLSAGAAQPIDLATYPDKTWNPTAAYAIGADGWAVKDWESMATFGTATNYLMPGYANRFHFYGGSVGYEATDSWLRSPGFVVKKGCTYTIRFSYRTDGTVPYIPLEYWFNAIDPTLKKADATALGKEKNDCGEISITKKVTAYTETSLECVAQSDGTAYLSFRVYSDGMSDEITGRLYMAGFSVCESGGAAAAAAPTDVKALAAADGVLAVDVSWTLPTVDTDGQPLEGDRAIEKVVVYRDGEPAATLPADTNSWRDNADAGLVPGNHSYEVAVSVAGQEGLKSEKVESGYVGPFTYAPLGMQGWTTYKASTLGFTGPFTGQKPAGYLDSYTIWSLDETEVDTWLSSPELPLSADKNYKIGFQYQKWAEMKAKSLKVYLSPVPAAAEHVAAISALTPIYELADITGTDTKWTEVLLKEVPGNGAYVIFHVSGTYQKRLTISAFSVEEDSSVPFVPASPMDLKAAVSGLSVQLTWTNPTESVSGDVFTEEQSIEAVVVQRDGEEIARLEGGETEFTDNKDSGLVAGTHSYAVSVVVAGVESALSDAVEVSCIDPSVPVELPWQSDFNNNRDEFTSLWNSHAAEGHSPLLGLWYHHNAGQIAFMNNNGYGENAWLVGPLVSFDTAAEYTVTFDATDSAGKESVLRFGLVESPGSSEFLHVIEENLEFPATSGKTEVKFTFIPVTTYNSISGTPANMHIALQAASTDVSHRVFLYSMKVDKKEITLGLDRTVDMETDMLVSVEVYDLSGRRLGTASSVALDGYDAGLYIVKLNYSESSPRTLKIAK